MKAISTSTLAVLLAIVFSSARSFAQETQSLDMRLYPPTSIEWKAGPASIPLGAKMAVLEGDPTKEGVAFTNRRIATANTSICLQPNAKCLCQFARVLAQKFGCTFHVFFVTHARPRVRVNTVKDFANISICGRTANNCEHRLSEL